MGCGGGKGFDPNVVTIDHFEVQRVVGQGGFGKVNAVVKKDNNAWYAMKKLDKAPVLANDSVGMIFNERNLLLAVDHPYMVNMFFAFQDEEACYLVLDLQMGGDLRYHLKPKYGEAQAKFYIACIANALEYLHSVKILHRDVKPENVVLDTKGYPRLTDLGISFQCADDQLTCTLKSGTKPYMAPEQLTSSHWHNRTADYWQLGITLHEFLVGKRPHASCNKGWMAALGSDSKQCELDEDTRRAPVLAAMGSCSEAAQSCVNDLLAIGHWERLGNNGLSDLKGHAFFADIDWDALGKKTMTPPFVPDSNKANCDTGENELNDFFMDAPKKKACSESEQAMFNGYDFNTDVQKPDKANVTPSG